MVAPAIREPQECARNPKGRIHGNRQLTGAIADIAEHNVVAGIVVGALVLAALTLTGKLWATVKPKA